VALCDQLAMLLPGFIPRTVLAGNIAEIGEQQKQQRGDRKPAA
jgi:hypothetical protein